MDELRIDEGLLNECLHLLTTDENMQHRGLRNLIEMIAMAGYRYRSEYRIVLFQGDSWMEQLTFPVGNNFISVELVKKFR